jgi:hypothetical protein
VDIWRGLPPLHIDKHWRDGLRRSLGLRHRFRRSMLPRQCLLRILRFTAAVLSCSTADSARRRKRHAFPSLILDTPPLHAAHFVGGELGDPPPTITDLHELSPHAEEDFHHRKLLIVRIRHFANRDGMPLYRVVVDEPT